MDSLASTGSDVVETVKVMTAARCPLNHIAFLGNMVGPLASYSGSTWNRQVSPSNDISCAL